MARYEGVLNVPLRLKQNMRKDACYHLFASQSGSYWGKRELIVGDIYEYLSYTIKSFPVDLFYEVMEKLREDDVISYSSLETYNPVKIIDNIRCYHIGQGYE